MIYNIGPVEKTNCSTPGLNLKPSPLLECYSRPSQSLLVRGGKKARIEEVERDDHQMIKNRPVTIAGRRDVTGCAKVQFLKLLFFLNFLNAGGGYR